MITWHVETEPLILELGSQDWSKAETFCLPLKNARRTGASVGIEIFGPEQEKLGGTEFFVDWIGDNDLMRWMNRIPFGTKSEDWTDVRTLKLSCLEPGWWPTMLEVGEPVAIEEEPFWKVNESDTVIEMPWSNHGTGMHLWQPVPELSHTPAGNPWVTGPSAWIRCGFPQSEEPGGLTVERRFNLDVDKFGQILTKLSWDRQTTLEITALVDGGQEIEVCRDEEADPHKSGGWRTFGANISSASHLDALRITIREKQERAFDERNVEVSLFWVLLREPTALDDEPVKPVTVRLVSSVKPDAGEVKTMVRDVQQIQFEEGPPPQAPIGDPTTDGLPFGFYVRREELPDLRRRALEGIGKPIFEQIRAKADHAISSEIVDQNYYGTGWGGGVGHPKGLRGSGMRVFGPEVALTHLITGDEKYALACRRWILRSARSDDWRGDHGGMVDRPHIGDRTNYWDSITEWNPKGSAGFMDHAFHVADSTYGIAVAYDMLYHCFSDSEREEVEDAMAEHGVYMLYHKLSRQREGYVAMNQGVLFCLPLLMTTGFLKDRDPVYAEMHKWSLEFLKEFGTRPWNHEGVCGEGPGYGMGTVWEYIEALPPIAACEGLRGDGQSRSVCTTADMIPDAMNGLMDYFQHVRSTWREKPYFIGLSDGSDLNWVFPEVLAFFARYASDSVAQFFYNESYSDHPSATPTMLLILGDPIEPTEPQLPPAKVMFDQGMAFLRTGWKHGDTLLSMNNLRTITGHGHLDRNSIILDYNGEELLLDPGMIAYGDPNSRRYHSTFCHNTLTFSQGDQSTQRKCLKNGIRHFLHMSGDECPGIDGSIDWVSTDASEAYDDAELFLRHILFLRPGIFVLIDEVRAYQPEQTEINFTCLGPIDLSRSAKTTLEGNGESFISRATHNTLTIHSQATAPLNHSFKNWGTTWPNIPSYRLIRSTTEKVDSATFMTALIPQAKEQSLPVIERLEIEGGLGVRITCGGQQGLVVFQIQQKQIVLNEIASDAKIFTLNTVQGEASAVAMLDGTTLDLSGQAVLVSTGNEVVGSMSL
jgi:hypothetical protein